jgi:hypothetical protein
MEHILTIISSGAVSVALSGTLVFLFRNWISERIKGAIQHEYNEKLETHKAQLQSRNDIEIEKLKADLIAYFKKYPHCSPLWKTTSKRF